MQEYYTILLEKSNTVQEIKRIESQNGELELLLSKYLSSAVNEELCVPPSI